MKTGQFTKVLTLTLVFQMGLSPVAFAQSATDVITQGLQQILGAQQAIIAQQQSAIMSAQRQSQIDPTNCDGRRCVSEIFPQCNILKTIPNIIDEAVCRPPGLNPGNPNDLNRFYQALSVFNDYRQLETMYRDFAVVSTQRSNEGMTCLSRAATDLDLALENREKQIDDLIKQISDAQTEFRQNTLLPDLTAIEDSQALLEGNAFRGRKTALDQNSVQFGDTFDDPSCSAVLNTQQFNEEGQARGLMGIEARLLTINSRKQNDSAGSFNATEFTGLAAKNLQDQIIAMSNFIANDVRSNPEGLTSSANGINDIYGIVANSRLVPAILAEQNREQQSFIRDLNLEVADYNQPRNTQNITGALFGSSDEAFEEALIQYERDRNSACFERSANIQNLMNGSITMFRDGATQSGQVNAFLSNINSILTNPNLSPDEKLKQINTLERQGSNSRYYLTLPTPLPIPQPDGSVITIKPSQRLSPADFIEYHVTNCRSQFNARNGKKASDAKMLKEFRKTRNKYSNYRKSLPNKVKNAITNRLVNCTDNVQANSSGSATCSAADLSTSSPTFCVKRANSCASKMRSCYAKAKDKVKDVTKRRDNHIGRYRANINRNKAQLQGMYSRLTTILAQQSFLQENSPLRQSLVLPPTVSVNLNFDERLDRNNYVRGLDKLEIDNPDTFFDRTNQNLVAVKAALAEQRSAIMNGSSSSTVNSEIARGVNGHIQSIQSNFESAKRVAENAKEQCNQTIQRYLAGYQQIQDQQAQAANEAMTANNQLCTNHSAFAASPGCDQEETLQAISDAATEAGRANSIEAVEANAFRAYCRRLNSETESESNFEGMTDSVLIRTAERRCRGSNPSSDCATFFAAGYCTKLNARTTTGSTTSSAGTESITPFAQGRRDNYEALLSTLGISNDSNGCPVFSSDTTMLQATCLTAIKNALDENSSLDCGDGAQARQGDLAYQILSGSTSRTVAGRDDAAEFRRIQSQLGENRLSSSCAGQNNSGAGTIVDSFNQGFGSGQPTGPTNASPF